VTAPFGKGKSIQPTSAFAGDDGSADAELTALLAGHAAGTVPLTDVVARLARTRVLVPVLAELGRSEETAEGLHVDKEAAAGVVALEAPDGRRALPVFTSVAAMAAWRPDVLGSVVIGSQDGAWTQVIYFTSEAEARAGERTDPPPELRKAMEEMAELSIGETTFLDLRQPLLQSAG